MSRTIFMIHGMWGAAWCWENYRRFFETQGYECVATTLRHHGIEGRRVADSRLGVLSLLDYLDDLELELNELDDVPILFGHSMGGLLGQMLAARGRASALVLLTPASPAGILAITPSVARRYATVSTCKEYEDHAHWIMGEPGWEEVAGDVAAWLRSSERAIASADS